MVVGTRRVQALPNSMKMKMFEKIRDFNRFDDDDDQSPDRHEFGPGPSPSFGVIDIS